MEVAIVFILICGGLVVLLFSDRLHWLSLKVFAGLGELDSQKTKKLSEKKARPHKEDRLLIGGNETARLPAKSLLLGSRHR